MSSYKIAVLPGDGIGPEVMEACNFVMESISKKYSLEFEFQEAKIGGIAIDTYGTALPESTLEICKSSDGILLGSIGGPKWEKLPPEQQPERAALLPLRKYFNLFCNIRPSKIYPGLEESSPIKNSIIANGFNILCIRELTSGIYFGKKGENQDKEGNISAFDIMEYSELEILRIAKIAFQSATKRNNKVTSIDKANVLSSSLLWRKTVEKVSKEFPNVTLNHMYIDNATMQLMKNPNDFDVLLCSNMFGDILSDQLAMISGSIGLLPSASINENNFGVYEPSGGSAPDIAGKKIANPIAQISSFAMLLKHSLNELEASVAIEKAISSCIQEKIVTRDISLPNAKILNTIEMGKEIAERI